MRELEPRLAEAHLYTLAHLFERRLGRPLIEDERDVLMTRVNLRGSTPIADLVLDLSAPDLAVWLAHDEVVGGG